MPKTAGHARTPAQGPAADRSGRSPSASGCRRKAGPPPTSSAKGFRILRAALEEPGRRDRHRGAPAQRLLIFVEVKARERLDDAAWSVTAAPAAAHCRRGRSLACRQSAIAHRATFASTPSWSRQAACRGTFRLRSWRRHEPAAVASAGERMIPAQPIGANMRRARLSFLIPPWSCHAPFRCRADGPDRADQHPRRFHLCLAAGSARARS